VPQGTGGYNTLAPHSQYNSSKPVTVKSLTCKLLNISQHTKEHKLKKQRRRNKLKKWRRNEKREMYLKSSQYGLMVFNFGVVPAKATELSYKDSRIE
jgi:ribosomal protein S15P/S13E